MHRYKETSGELGDFERNIGGIVPRLAQAKKMSDVEKNVKLVAAETMELLSKHPVETQVIVMQKLFHRLETLRVTDPVVRMILCKIIEDMNTALHTANRSAKQDVQV